MSCVVKDWAVDQVEKVDGRGTSMGEAEVLKDLSLWGLLGSPGL